MPTSTLRLLILAIVSCLLAPTAVHAGRVSQAEFSSVAEMVTAWAPRSAAAAASIREEYRPYVELLALDRFEDIETGLSNQGLVPLPQDSARFNIIVRREGPSPIGEKDLARQDSYVSARAATIGCLLDVASRITSGPIEVTSLVRHLEYQHELGTTNANAMTDVPTHALGLAFDIAVVNTPLATVLELQDVLRRMSDAGDILVIAEREQLVFHVVPQPSRLGWFADVYARAVNGQPLDGPRDDDRRAVPTVITSIGALRPTARWASEWWAADNVPVDLQVAVRGNTDTVSAFEPVAAHRIPGLPRLGELLSNTWHWLSPANHT